MSARNHIDLVVKAIRVLETLAAGPPAMTLKHIATKTGLVKSSAFRILFTLKEMGYVEQPGNNGSYSITFKVAGLVRRAPARPALVTVARPYLGPLRDILQESVWLGERRRNAVIVVDLAEAAQPLRLSFDIGDSCPLHATALGKAIAAHLSLQELIDWLGKHRLFRFTPHTNLSRTKLKLELAGIRREGYSVNDQETVAGAILIAAPVFDANRRVCAAVSVSTPLVRYSAARKQAIVRNLLSTTKSISQNLLQIGFAIPEFSLPRPDNPHLEIAG
jgi:IclR family acetate operon transcriptional repressor